MRNRPIDPLAPTRHQSNMGAGALNRNPRNPLSIGEVVACHANTHVMTVRLENGQIIEAPILRKGPRDFELLDVGTTVVISWDLPLTPIILGVIDLVGQELSPLGDTEITGTDNTGSNDPLQPVNSTANYRPADCPPDLGEGDWAKTGDRNQTVSLLKGGIAQIGSPTAQVRSFGMSGLLQFIGQRMQSVSDFGTWKILNNEGKTSFVLRAGSNQTTETGFGEEHWTIKIDLGAEGDVFVFETTDTSGSTNFRFHVDSQGEVEFFGNDGITTAAGNDSSLDVNGNYRTRITGSNVNKIEGDRTQIVGGSSTDTISIDKVTNVGNDIATIVNRNSDYYTGGNLKQIISGGSSDNAKPTNKAYSLSILNGSWFVDIGDPKKLSNPLAKSGWDLKTYTGSINLDSGEDFKLKARQHMNFDAQLITLNGSTSPLPTWATFEKELQQFLTILLTAIAAGTQGGPTAQKLVAVDAAQPLLRQFISNLGSGVFDSKKVRNG